MICQRYYFRHIYLQKFGCRSRLFIRTLRFVKRCSTFLQGKLYRADNAFIEQRFRNSYRDTFSILKVWGQISWRMSKLYLQLYAYISPSIQSVYIVYSVPRVRLTPSVSLETVSIFPIKVVSTRQSISNLLFYE